MGKPLAKLGAGRHVLQPRVKAQKFLFDPTGPEALHQKTEAILWSRRFVHTLELNHCRLYRQRRAMPVKFAIRRRYSILQQSSCAAMLTLNYIIVSAIQADIDPPLRVE